MIQHYLLLVAGVVCAALGGELFLRAVLGLGAVMRISPAILGATLAAFATSSPEFSVAVNAALERRPEIALGDALGSNLVNIALVLGLAVVISPIRSPHGSLRRDFPVALAVPAVTAALLFDGTLSRVDGVLLLCGFLTWLGAVVTQAKKERRVNDTSHASAVRAAVQGGGGVLLLFAAGRFIVDGATGVAVSYGISPFVVGATIVAAGTSVPELATAVVAKLRGHDDVSLGMLLGSNIFNGLWIVGVASAINPIVVQFQEVVLALAWGVLVMIVVFPPRDGLIGRARGSLLLTLYAGYVAAVLAAGAE